MKPRFIAELVEGARIDAAYVIRSKELRTARTGDPYLWLEISDRSGAIHAVLFRPSDTARSLPVGAVARVAGSIAKYRGRPRVTVETLVPAESWDPDDFLQPGRRPAAEVEAEFTALVRSVRDAECRGVLRRVFGDASFRGSFMRSPASQSHHHAYVGGLVEHTIAVSAVCAQLAGRYDGVDRDLLVTAALLHDIGKVDEIECETGVMYSDAGRLIGHVVLGLQRVARALSTTSLGERRSLLLQHAIVSHHGELEWGAPKQPATLEALILHHADNLDAKAAGLSALLTGATAADEAWTDAHNQFRRPLHASRSELSDRVNRVDADDVQVLRTA